MSLILHRGAREVTRDDLFRVETPQPQGRWHPVSHGHALEAVEQTLQACGFSVETGNHALSRGGARYFGTLDIAVPIVPGVKLAVGIRNSTDQSFPLGFCAGHRVFVCDNLAFRAELMAKRKHTLNGAARFRDDIASCISKLDAFRLAEQSRIERMKSTHVDDTRAESLMLRAYERKLVSHRMLPALIDAWREPDAAEFAPRDLWSLFNSFTHALKPAQSNPQRHARLTMGLHGLLVGYDSPALNPYIDTNGTLVVPD